MTAITSTTTTSSAPAQRRVLTSPTSVSSSAAATSYAAQRPTSPATTTASLPPPAISQSSPPPSSFPLLAALQAQMDLTVGHSVYLLDPQYLQNWFVWALHQNVPERDRVREALRAAAIKHGLVPPNESMSYTDPGPIDSTALAVEGHPLVLSPWVQVLKTSGRGGVGMMVSTTINCIKSNIIINGNSANNPNTPMSSMSEASPFRRARHKSFMSDSDLPGVDDDDDDDDDNNGNSKNSNKTDNLANATAVDDTTANTNQAKRNLQLQCVAVPEEFYETLRAVHGVVCEDYRSVSFQRYIGNAERFLLHHQQRWRKQAPLGSHHHHSINNDGHGNNEQQQHAVPLHDTVARPVEFRRKVILQIRPPDEPSPDKNKNNISLMDKLLLEEEVLTHRNMIPTVEVHPLKLVYTVVHDDDDYSHTDDSSTISSKASQTTPFSTQHQHPQSGYVLVSRSTPAVDALLALLRVAAPNKATQSVRLWSQQLYGTTTTTTTTTNCNVMTRATQEGDEYELVDMDIMKNNNLAEQQKLQLSAERVTVQEWVERHGIDTSTSTTTTTTATTTSTTAGEAATGGSRTTRNTKNRELHVLVETRRTINSPWPRESFELENRLQVGDFVDAQDVAGKWYEAIVRQVDDNVVTVHYAGWASRWDAKIRRRREMTSSSDANAADSLEGVSTKIKAPAPLWSQTGRWRERLCVGDVVEVRDSSSIVQRPKWYRGIVKEIGKPTDKMREIMGGAELEEYPVEGDPTKKEKLLILNRTQQVLVEVEQEKSDKAIVRTSPSEGYVAAGLTPQPPYLRWVNLYGEEICKINTHLKGDSIGPATLKYEFERDRKPVEILKPRNTLLGSGFMRESLRGTPPAPGSVGLQNLGNSCFLNATIQCLNHIEPLTQYFLQDKYSTEINRRNPLGSGGNVVTAYASLLKKMWSGEYSILAPRLLKQTVANFAPQFDNSYQHDSQEFCQFLMDGIHEDLNRVKNKPYVEELEGFGMEDEWTAIESWRKHLLRHDSIIVDHCQGMHRSHLTCPHCGRESIKFDVYSSISLPLVTFKDQRVINLEDCIEKFMEGEQLDERNAWYCPSCRKHVCALKMIALWSVPDILVLHLKRFTFDTCLISGGMLRSKIDAVIEFPIEGLDLTEYVLGPIDESAPPVYKLFGVSEHTGPTANSGHYTATVRNSIDDQWYRCNDSHVGRTSGEASMTGGAYVLFYQRTKGLSKWGGMHKVMIDQGIDPYGGLETDQEGFKKVKAKKKRGAGRK